MVTRRTTAKQFAIYIEFMRKNPTLVAGRLGPNLKPEELFKLWNELSLALNSVRDGPSKTVAAWKKTFIEWKSFVRKKHRLGKSLSIIENNLIELSENVAVENKVVVRVIPTAQQEMEQAGETLVVKIEEVDVVTSEDNDPLESGSSEEGTQVRFLDSLKRPVSEEEAHGSPSNVYNRVRWRSDNSKARNLRATCTSGQEIPNKGLMCVAHAIQNVADGINRLVDVLEQKLSN